jgi:hypothetical protein
LKDQRNNGELHRADPAYRRFMQIVLVVTVVAGIALLAALHFWLQRMGARIAAGDLFGYERSLHQVLGGLCIALGFASAVFALWLYRLAARTRAERRWPPSAMRTSADMRIRYLTSADSLVVQMKGGAFALALAAALMLGWGAWLLHTA